MIQEIVTGFSEIGLTLLGLGIGWFIILWLDKNVFNRGRYNKRRKK